VGILRARAVRRRRPRPAARVGGEQLFLDRLLAGRLGVYYDFQLPGADPIPTIGFGVEYAGFSFDVAGAYDFDKSAGGLTVGFGYTM